MDLITTAAPENYTPSSTSIKHDITASLVAGERPGVVHITQYDQTLPIIAVRLMGNNVPYAVPAGAAVNFRARKPDGKYVYNPALGISADGSTAYIAVTPQTAAAAGKMRAVIEIVLDGAIAATANFCIEIAANPVPQDAIDSQDEYLTIQDLAQRAFAAAEAAKESETSAANSASAAANSATAAQTSAEEAEASASDAGTYASAAQSSAQDAAASAAAAEGSYTAASAAAQSASNAADSAADAQNAAASVDSEGLLKQFLLAAYPIGSLYWSSNSTSPATLFGGTWARITGRFVWALADGTASGSTGGSSTINLQHLHSTGNHALTIDEMPSHNHSGQYLMGGTGATKANLRYDGDGYIISAMPQKGGSNAHNHGNTGNALSTAQSIMPPYVAKYCWERTA